MSSDRALVVVVQRRALMAIRFRSGASGGAVSATQFDYLDLKKPDGTYVKLSVTNDLTWEFDPPGGSNQFDHIELKKPDGTYVRVSVTDDLTFLWSAPGGTNQRDYVDMKQPDGTYVRISATNDHTFTFQEL